MNKKKISGVLFSKLEYLDDKKSLPVIVEIEEPQVQLRNGLANQMRQMERATKESRKTRDIIEFLEKEKIDYRGRQKGKGEVEFSLRPVFGLIRVNAPAKVIKELSDLEGVIFISEDF